MISSLATALRFLTIVPLPGRPSQAPDALARALPFFPLAGALIGLLLVGLGRLVSLVWADPAPAVLVVIVWGLLSSGLHLDGLSDPFDGVLSWRSRERQLEIMRDSRVGVMGVLALAAVLGLKVAWLLAAAANWPVGVALAPLLGRWAMVYAVCRFPAARESGLGQSLQSQVGPGSFAVATALTVGLCLALGGLRGLLALVVVAAATQALARWWSRSLGGLTGDTYGAVCEISEAVALAAAAASL